MVYCATAVRPAAVVHSSGSSMMPEPGKNAGFRYRVVIHPDDAMAADINPQYSEYLRGSLGTNRRWLGRLHFQVP